MRGGFSFCGVDIADIGLEYAPDNSNTYVYGPAETIVHEETFEGHNGGYSYGAYKQPKEFVLRCFYEDSHIAKGVMAKAHSLFRVGKKGILVFQRRPWCYYYATVTSVDPGEMYSYLNGMFVITMKAYYPFARGLAVNNHLFYSLPTDECHAEIMENTAMFDNGYMMPAMTFTNISTQRSILLYNPGTERAKVDIVVSGEAGDGITIANTTTGQSCRYIAFNTNDGEIYTDGINGKVTATKDGVEKLGFLYHDYGFIELEPAFPILRNLYISYENQQVTSTNILYEYEDEKGWYEDKYIFIGADNTGSWYQINQCVDKYTLTLKQSAQSSGSCKTNVVPMNEIIITPSAGTSISTLSFVYKPTFA